MEYYSSRNGNKIITIDEFYSRISLIFEDYGKRSYFKENLNLLINSEFINRKSTWSIGFPIYPFNNWPIKYRNQEHIFDSIEFLFQFVSKPGDFGYKADHTGFNSEDFLSYDREAGKSEYLIDINSLLIGKHSACHVLQGII